MTDTNSPHPSSEPVAKAASLVEQLRVLPEEYVLQIHSPNALGGMDTRNIPIGRICHEAASALSSRTQALPPTVGEWRPIETAPRSGTKMYVVQAFNVHVLGRLYTSDPYCVWPARFLTSNWVRWPHEFAPTHWMPLPPPPVASTISAEKTTVDGVQVGSPTADPQRNEGCAK